MKITIWQQFSSNHSASFTVAGKFATVENAEKGAQIVRGALQRIQSFYRTAYPSVQDFWNFAKQYELSSVESSIKQELNLDTWTIPLDWVYFEEVEDIVILFQNILFVSISWETWTGETPIDQLLEHLGGEVVVSLEGGGRESYLIVSCEAPALETAIELEKELVKQKYTDRSQVLSIPNTSLEDWSLLTRYDRVLSLEMYAYSMKRQIAFLQAYVSYLERKGCIKFSYSLQEVSNSNDSNP